MKRDVILTISGLHSDAEADNGIVETLAAAEYFQRNGSHYVLYEEKTEGFQQSSKSKIKIKENMVELTRQGLVDTHMIFEENKTHMTRYNTPYGQLLLGVDTQKIQVWEQEDCIRVVVEYRLEESGEPMSDCRIEICIREK